jgi:hypothetical protein
LPLGERGFAEPSGGHKCGLVLELDFFGDTVGNDLPPFREGFRGVLFVGVVIVVVVSGIGPLIGVVRETILSLLWIFSPSILFLSSSSCNRLSISLKFSPCKSFIY